MAATTTTTNNNNDSINHNQQWSSMDEENVTLNYVLQPRVPNDKAGLNSTLYPRCHTKATAYFGLSPLLGLIRAAVVDIWTSCRVECSKIEMLNHLFSDQQQSIGLLATKFKRTLNAKERNCIF